MLLTAIHQLFMEGGAVGLISLDVVFLPLVLPVYNFLIYFLHLFG